MRVMKVFQIQKNYQHHKKRLSCISIQNAKQKTNSSTISHIFKINNYKKNKVSSSMFKQQEKNKNLSKQNCKIHMKLNKVYLRGMNQNNKQKSLSRQSFRSSSRQSRIQQIRNQNSKLHRKIQTTQSYYTRIRKNIKCKKLSQKTKKQQIIDILQNQLKLKPQVMFPTVKKKHKSNLSYSDTKI